MAEKHVIPVNESVALTVQGASDGRWRLGIEFASEERLDDGEGSTIIDWTNPEGAWVVIENAEELGRLLSLAVAEVAKGSVRG